MMGICMVFAVRTWKAVVVSFGQYLRKNNPRAQDSRHLYVLSGIIPAVLNLSSQYSNTGGGQPSSFEVKMVTNDLYGKPFQLKFVRPAQMLLFANAVCDPPLGQSTVVPYGETVRAIGHVTSSYPSCLAKIT